MKETFNKKLEAMKINYDLDSLESKEKELKERIKVIALEEYNKTKKKSLLGGIKIQETKVYNYDDEKAFEWAKEHSLCLQLDTKAFKKIISSQDLGFVTKDIENKVTFPSVIKLED